MSPAECTSWRDSGQTSRSTRSWRDTAREPIERIDPRLPLAPWDWQPHRRPLRSSASTRGTPAAPNLTTEPIGPGSSIRKIKDGRGAPARRGSFSRSRRRTRPCSSRRGYRVAMTRTGPSFTLPGGGNIDARQVLQPPPTPPSCSVSTPTGRATRASRGLSTLYPAWHRRLDGRHPTGRAGGPPARPGESSSRTGAANRGLVAPGRSHRVQLGERPVVPRRDGLHDEPGRRRPLRSARYQWKVARGLGLRGGCVHGLPLALDQLFSRSRSASSCLWAWRVTMRP